MSETKKEKSMYLYTGEYEGHPTFYAMPSQKEAPFTHLIYDPILKGLAVVGTFLKQGFVFEDKLDSNGIPEEVQGKKANELKKKHPNFPPFKRERLSSQVSNEYYIKDPKEQAEIIARFCENHTEYDFQKFLDAPAAIQKSENMQMIPQGTPEDIKK